MSVDMTETPSTNEMEETIDSRFPKGRQRLTTNVDGGGDSNTTATNNEREEEEQCNQKKKQKRKGSKANSLTSHRSMVWDHFTKFQDASGSDKSKCNYCDKEFCTNTRINGTTSLRHHLERCKKFPHNHETRQTLLGFQPGKKDGETDIVVAKFDQEATRKALAYWLVVEELPFRLVETHGFKYFMAHASPSFHIPSRSTVTRDCFQLYLNERLKLKMFLKENNSKICITTDTWTSIQRINYMCLTAHFIDRDWKLQKKILNFCPITSHKGSDIGKAVELCLLEWGIDRLFTITVDNASSNDGAILYLKKKIVNWGTDLLNGQFMHMRCVAHIINLIVVDGLKDLSKEVSKVRALVRYIRQSPSRLQKFKDCVAIEKIQCKKMLSLDTPTRWNSTYLMLDAAQKFERAFERYEEQDFSIVIDLEKDDGLGLPSKLDWENVRRFSTLLENFFNLTLKVSGSLYVTSNTFLVDIVEVNSFLKNQASNDDSNLRLISTRIRENLTNIGKF